MNYQALIDYWQEVAKHDLKTMDSLFKSRRYSDSLFFGHLVLEKILKAAVVAKTKAHPKFIHNLSILAVDAGLQLPIGDLEFLTEVNKFNLHARYPDYKLHFYRTCNAEYTKPRIAKIHNLYRKICTLLEI